jgi:hypothetical protein
MPSKGKHMTAQQHESIEEIFSNKERITAAVTSAVREAILRHKQAGNPIVVMKDGKMVWLQPDEIKL